MKKPKKLEWRILEFTPTSKSRNKNKFVASEGRWKEEIVFKVPGQEKNSVGYSIDSMLRGPHSVEDGCYRVSRVSVKGEEFSIGSRFVYITEKNRPLKVQAFKIEGDNLRFIFSDAGSYVDSTCVEKLPDMPDLKKIIFIGGPELFKSKFPFDINDLFGKQEPVKIFWPEVPSFLEEKRRKLDQLMQEEILKALGSKEPFCWNVLADKMIFEPRAEAAPWWSKIKFPIFESADGQPMYEGDAYYHVTSRFEVQEEKVVASGAAEYRKGNIKRFKDSAKAYEYRNSFALFTTEDSVKMFPGMTVYYVLTEKDWGKEPFKVYSLFLKENATYRWNKSKTFSNKKVAEEFIMMKKPVFSFEEVYKIFIGNSGIRTVTALEHIAKEKCGLNVNNNQDQCMKRSDQMQA